MTSIHPVILCGGSGTRLWPSSRKAYPKQFTPLIGEESLYQTTLRRLSAEGFAAPLVMTGNDFRFLATDQAAAIGLIDVRVVVEPCPRDSAPAILAAALMLENTPEDLMLIAPSDHVIADTDSFLASVRAGVGPIEIALILKKELTRRAIDGDTELFDLLAEVLVPGTELAGPAVDGAVTGDFVTRSQAGHSQTHRLNGPRPLVPEIDRIVPRPFVGAKV